MRCCGGGRRGLTAGRRHHCWWKVRHCSCYSVDIDLLYVIHCLLSSVCCKVYVHMCCCTHALLWGWQAEADGWATAPLLVEGDVTVLDLGCYIC
jgi:hypothetical protein